MEDEEATLEGQFLEFSKLFDPKHRDGTTITLYRNDYWFRQAKILDDRQLTMTDTGLVWWRLAKTELNWDEWYDFLTVVCADKELNQENVEILLTNCGIPGSVTVNVPQYRDFFIDFKPKQKMIYE